jgi:hypothetical protein
VRQVVEAHTDHDLRDRLQRNELKPIYRRTHEIFSETLNGLLYGAMQCMKRRA